MRLPTVTKMSSEKKKVLPLKNMPDSIKEIILHKQANEKIKCNCVRSLEWSIYAIIREWKAFNDQAKFISNTD